jgi:glycerol kinase
VLEALNIPEAMLPGLVDTTGIVGKASALPGQPPIAALVGDQQGSLLGQACVQPGQAKVTFGTGGMLDVCLGAERPAAEGRGPNGTFPIVAWTKDGQLTWGAEAIMLSAGTSVAWLVEDLQLLASPAETEAVAAQCDDTGDVWFVPAMLGLGTPHWDYGARSTFVGLTRGSGRPELVRAVLEGIAHRGTDLVEATEADTGVTIPTLRVDGGMSANRVFVQALADASQRPVEVSPIADATTLGAGYLAGLAVGTWSGPDDLAAAWRPGAVARWQEAVARAQGWIPSLSALDF